MPDSPEQTPDHGHLIPGPVALVGSGEYLEVMIAIDRALLEGRPPKAVFLPTAAAQEGPDIVKYWLDLGHDHFSRLGVEPFPLQVLDRTDADNPTLASVVAGAGLIYLSGGNPGYLADTLRGTLVWEAIVEAWRGGAALAGCSAGACALSWAAANMRGNSVASGGQAGEGRPSGLALVADVAVIPHFDQIVNWVPGIVQHFIDSVPPAIAIIGVDEDTAIVSAERARAPFTVAGRQAAYVIGRDGSRQRFEAGATITPEDLGA